MPTQVVGLLVTTVLAVAGAIQTAPNAKIPDSPVGRIAAAFIAMINDGSAEAVRRFETAHRSPRRLDETPVDARVPRVADMHQRWAPLAVEEVLTSGASGLTIVARTRAGEVLELEFMLDAEAPGKLDGVLVASGGPAGRSMPLDAERRASTIEGACAALEEHYVFPKIAAAMAASVRAKQAAGEYDSITSEMALSRRLTDDFRAISKDLHLGLRLAPGTQEPTHAEQMGGPADENYLFRKVEILDGNIGLVRLDGFVGGPEAEPTAAAAMAFVANADAIIFDLRVNGGGDPEMIRFIQSYLFEAPTHLNSMIDREGKVVEEFWTLADVPGQRLGADVPVFVLTSRRTFSGAEEFAYNLKNLKRGVIIGETTGGGAHPVRGVRLNDRFVLGVPYLRANNPISKTNWEGTGVAPDIDVPADAALDRAIEEARAAIARAGSGAPGR
jgi:hypothetical protein